MDPEQPWMIQTSVDRVPGTGSPEGVCIKQFWAGKLVPEGVPNKNKGACIKQYGAESGPVPLFYDSFL